MAADTVTAHEERSPGPPLRATFREVARATDNPKTKLLGEGLTAPTEALRELDAGLGRIEQVQSSPSANAS